MNIKTDICLRQTAMRDKRSDLFISLYNQTKKGILPIVGGWLDQPNVFADAVDVLDAYFATEAGD